MHGGHGLKETTVATRMLACILGLMTTKILCGLRLAVLLRPAKRKPLQFLQHHVRCANTQPFLCNELGPFQAIFRQFSGNLRQFVWGPFQVISGNFRQFVGNFRQFQQVWGAKTQEKNQFLIHKIKAEDCTPKPWLRASLLRAGGMPAERNCPRKLF